MFELINAFLQAQGVNVLFKYEFDDIVAKVAADKKIQAIKFLREQTMKMAHKTWVLDEREDYTAAITTWIKHNNRQEIPGTEREVHMDLKTAKEMVEFIVANSDHTNS